MKESKKSGMKPDAIPLFLVYVKTHLVIGGGFPHT